MYDVVKTVIVKQLNKLKIKRWKAVQKSGHRKLLYFSCIVFDHFQKIQHNLCLFLDEKGLFFGGVQNPSVGEGQHSVWERGFGHSTIYSERLPVTCILRVLPYALLHYSHV